MQTVLAKAVYDNIADSTDELTFRKGDIITVLEKDIDGLFGWWLCSLHGRQGIAPGNRLSEIGKGTPPPTTPTTPLQQSILDDLDYAVPKSYEDAGDDYDIPRSILSPQDYDFPKPDEKFDFKPVENGEKTPEKDNDGNIYQEIYDVPNIPSPKKVPPRSPVKDAKASDKVQPKSKADAPLGQDKTDGDKSTVVQAPSSESTSPKSPLPKPHPKPPRSSIITAGKKKAVPPPRPPKPTIVKPTTKPAEGFKITEPKRDENIYSVPPSQEVHEVPKQEDSKPPAETVHEKEDEGKMVEEGAEKVDQQAEHEAKEDKESTEPSNAPRDEPGVEDNTASYPQDIYDVPTVDLSSGDIYDVPQALKPYANDDIYDTPPKIPTGSLERRTRPESPPKVRTGTNERPSHTPGKPMDINHNKRTEKPLEGPPLGVFKGGDSGSLERMSDVSQKRSSDGSTGKRSSNSSTGSGKHSSDSDDYVDYQEIYGFGRGEEKHVNIYDVPVQPVQVSAIETAPVEKKTTASILQRINMSAVKGLKLDPPAALQRLSKLEQAVGVTVTKLLTFVTSKWRDPVLLRPKIADIRDIAGKGKVALRLLTEFGLSTLVNARKIENEELSGKLSRAIEPLLETYYSLKLALQRLDESDWKAPLQRPDDGHDDLDLIMVYIRSVPENSTKLVGIVRTTATVLFYRPRKPPVPLPAKEKKTQPSEPEIESTKEAKSEAKNGNSKPPVTKPKPVTNGKDAKLAVNGEGSAHKEATEVQESEVEEGEGEAPEVRPKAGSVAEAIAKVEKFGVMTADSETIDATAMMLGIIKQSVEENFKPTGRKLSPGTVRRLCGMDPQGSPGEEESENASDASKSETNDAPDDVPKLPPRRPSNATKGAPPPPQRRDSGERLQHVRQKSLERFVPPEVEKSAVTNGPPNPPPKPKLDRHKTMRKSYKYSMQREKVKLREKVALPDSPTQGKRKCNSDPTDLEITPEETEPSQNRASDSIEGKVPENGISGRTNSVHISDSDLPTGLQGQSEMAPLSPKLDSPTAATKPSVQRSKSFSRTKPSSKKTTMAQESGFADFILSFSDKELIEFYKYEIDAQLFVLNEAMKGLFSSMDSSQPPKTFVSNSKFVVLSAHKFIYIGDTLQRKISHDKLGTDITSATATLSDCVKTLVHATKMAALQYPAMNPMRELTTAAAQVSDASIALHKIVKAGTAFGLTD